MNRKYALPLFAILAISFAACTKKKKVVVSPSVLLEAFVYDGQDSLSKRPWVTYTATATLVQNVALNLDIIADSTNSQIKIHIDNYKGVGSYSLQGGTNTATFVTSAYVYPFISTDGMVTILENTKLSSSETKIKGAFYFQAGTKNISSGTFNLVVDLD